MNNKDICLIRLWLLLSVHSDPKMCEYLCAPRRNRLDGVVIISRHVESTTIRQSGELFFCPLESHCARTDFVDLFPILRLLVSDGCPLFFIALL